MTFTEDLRRFSRTVDARQQAVFVNTVSAAQDSIQHGSALTGSPGQPVQSGNLKASWQSTFESKDVALISTNTVYAPDIEDGTRNGRELTLRSQVGGFHSVKHTIAGLPAIVANETAKLNGSAR